MLPLCKAVITHDNGRRIHCVVVDLQTISTVGQSSTKKKLEEIGGLNTIT